MSRQELDLGKLDQFTPRAPAGEATGDTSAADAPSGSGPAGKGMAGKGMAGQGMKAGLQRLLDDPAPAAGAGGGLEGGFPSREPVDEAQLNIKLPRAEAARFRRLAKADRYTLGAFLTLLMDGHEGRE